MDINNNTSIMKTFTNVTIKKIAVQVMKYNVCIFNINYNV